MGQWKKWVFGGLIAGALVFSAVRFVELPSIEAETTREGGLNFKKHGIVWTDDVSGTETSNPLGKITIDYDSTYVAGTQTTQAFDISKDRWFSVQYKLEEGASTGYLNLIYQTSIDSATSNSIDWDTGTTIIEDYSTADTWTKTSITPSPSNSIRFKVSGASGNAADTKFLFKFGSQ